MKKSHKIIIICIIAVLMLRVCLSGEKKKEKNILQQSEATTSLTITPDFTTTAPVNPNVFGVNIGFAFARELDKDSGFVQLLRAMHPVSLRFPGGTVANWYHPDLPVYGYKAKELLPSLGGLYALQSKRSENILYNFIRLCKEVNTNAVFCANLLTGTTEEVLFVIDELKKNNIPILGVELGNEYCLMSYRKQFPDAQTYIDRISTTALAIRNKYPDLKIAVIGGDAVAMNDMNVRSKFMRTWNQELSKVNFYDAYVWHFYASCSDCDKDPHFDNVFSRNLESMAPFKTNKLYNAGADFIPIFGKERKLWLTEWNISNGEYLDNTFTQAAYVSENFLNMIDLNIKYNNYIELSNLHAMDGLINIYKGKQKPLLSVGGNNATVQYFAFKFLATTLIKDAYKGATTISSKDNQTAKNFICNAFVNKKDNKTYLHFVNRSGKKMQLTINAKSSSGFQLTSIEADFPYATAGKTAYEKKYPDKLKPVRYREENFAENTINIAPYAFGYISY